MKKNRVKELLNRHIGFCEDVVLVEKLKTDNSEIISSSLHYTLYMCVYMRA